MAFPYRDSLTASLSIFSAPHLLGRNDDRGAQHRGGVQRAHVRQGGPVGLRDAGPLADGHLADAAAQQGRRTLCGQGRGRWASCFDAFLKRFSNNWRLPL